MAMISNNKWMIEVIYPMRKSDYEPDVPDVAIQHQQTGIRLRVPFNHAYDLKDLLERVLSIPERA